MAKITIENGSAGAVIRAAINDMFTEIYAKLVPATAIADGYLKKEDFDTFNKKQAALVNADASHDGKLTKEDWAAFNGKQAALTDPLCLVAPPATAGAAGTKGQWAQDGTYIYLCTATDTWVRAAVAFATWGA